MTDPYIVIDYLQSRELVDELNERIGLREISARPEVAEPFDDTLSIEEGVKYWRKLLRVGLDVASHLVTVEVRAFTVEDAKTVATIPLEPSEAQVNEISTRARADAVRGSQPLVKRMADLLHSQHGALASFCDRQQGFDASKQVEARYWPPGKLEEDLSQALECARVEADRRQRNVAAFVRPTLPEAAHYPRRIMASIAVFAISLLLRPLDVLIAYAILNHAP